MGRLLRKITDSLSGKKGDWIYVFESLEAPDGYRDELFFELQKLVVKSLQQPGCLRYELVENRDQANEFAVFMCFQSEKAYRDHIEADFIADFEKRLGPTHCRNVVEKIYRKI